MGLRLQILAVAVLASLAAGAAMVWQSAQPQVFAATSVLAVEAAPATAATAGGRPENIVFLARTYAARATTPAVLSDAIDRAGLRLDVDELRDRMSVEVSNTDATISVTGTATRPRLARRVTGAVATALQQQVRADQQQLRRATVAPLDSRIARLERRFETLAADSPRRFALQHEYQGLIAARAEAKLRPLDRMEELSPPVVANSVSPAPLRTGALAFLIAAVVGVEAIVAWRMLRRRRQLDEPVLTGPVAVDAPADATAAATG